MQGASIKAWAYLAIAIVGELGGTACLKLADGSARPLAWVGVVVGYGSALWLLNAVIQEMDIGVVYALWSGIGIALVAATGVLFFGERLSLMRAAGLLAIILG